MASNKPKNTAFKDLHQGIKSLGQTLSLDFQGEYKSAAVPKKTHVMIRVFYRINGVPFSQFLYSREAKPKTNGAGETVFVHDDNGGAMPAPQFIPGVRALHEFQIFSWDSKNGPADGEDHDMSKVCVLVR